MPADPRDRLIEGFKAEIDHLVNGLLGGQLDAATFHNQVLQALADYHVAAYLAGRGIRDLDEAGRDLALRGVAEQAGYLTGFTSAIEAGELSDSQIRSRAALYASSIVPLFSQAATWGADLPFHPADGGTTCRSGCRCRWERRGGLWYWLLGPVQTEHCGDCQTRASGSPYSG